MFFFVEITRMSRFSQSLTGLFSMKKTSDLLLDLRSVEACNFQCLFQANFGEAFFFSYEGYLNIFPVRLRQVAKSLLQIATFRC